MVRQSWEVRANGESWIADQEVTVNGEMRSLYVEAGAKVHLSGGSYFGKYQAIYVEDGNYAGPLSPGYAFFDDYGNMIAPAEAEDLCIVTVKPRY